MSASQFPVILLAATIVASLILFGLQSAFGITSRGRTVMGLIVLGLIGGFVAIAWFDDAMKPYDDERVARDLFALPRAATLGATSHGKTPMCWGTGRSFGIAVVMPTEMLARYRADPLDPSAFRQALAQYFATAVDRIEPEPGALAWQVPDPRHSQDGTGRIWPAEYAGYVKGGFICADLWAGKDSSSIQVRACDPLDTAAPRGDLGRILARSGGGPQHLAIEVRLASNGPACRNRVRHFMNDSLGYGRVP